MPPSLERFQTLSFVEENYVFEWCVWIGYAMYGFAFLPYGAIAIGGHLLIVASIFGVTDIPPTEAQAIRSKGDAYRDYKKRVSRFVPMPPESRSSDAYRISEFTPDSREGGCEFIGQMCVALEFDR